MFGWRIVAIDPGRGNSSPLSAQGIRTSERHDSRCRVQDTLAPNGIGLTLYFMQKTGFTEALEQIVAADPRYDREAYLFLQDALDFTMKSRKKQKTDLSRHVTGQELLEGVRVFAIKEYGPMVPTVFETWGIRRCDDFGEMVFNLIRAGIFGKTETDTIEDFRNGYDFCDAFVKPFVPEGRPLSPKMQPGEPVQQS